MRCPWPALRLARAMRQAGKDAAVRLLADDANAGREVAALGEAHGWTVLNPAEGVFDVRARSRLGGDSRG